jgi:glycosyltransferase involved in cell wall biosynthesis
VFRALFAERGESPVQATGAREERPAPLELSVVVPVRNAEHLLEACLASVAASNPREIVVVDGLSTDRSFEIAEGYGARILSDEGRGLSAARTIGAAAAHSPHVALIDADVVLPEGALDQLFQEFQEGGYDALQAGLVSSAGPGYWGQALVHHHRSGRSKNWFGLVATIFDQEFLLKQGFDERFRSGEDIELRWRLQRAGARIGVSRRTMVTHRFEDTYEFAKGQWLADGHGSGRMLRKYGARGAWVALIPVAAAARGVALSLVRRQPRWIPYYLCFAAFNYLGIAKELAGGLRTSEESLR